MKSPHSLDMMSLIFILTVISTLPYGVLAGNTNQCYSPNGAATKFTGGSMQIPLHACPAGADGFATCCAEGDICSGSDRLCYNPGGNAVWRNFCTDSTWKSTSCSPLCHGTTEWDSGPVQVTPCSDGMYCCGKNNTECCHQHQGTYAFQGVPINATSSGSGSGAKMSGASIAGIVVGIVGVISLGVCVYLLLRLRNEKSPKSFTSRTQESVYLHDHMAPNPEAPPPLHPQPSTVSRNHPSTSLHSKPSVRSHYVAEKRLPELPKEVYEMGGEGVTRFEVSGSAVKKEDRKFWS